jgi:hypothetical protein
MKDFFLAGKSMLKAWLVRLCSKRSVAGTGVALLDAQIRDLEKRCAAIQDRMSRRHHGVELKRGNENGADSPQNGAPYLAQHR